MANILNEKEDLAAGVPSDTAAVVEQEPKEVLVSLQRSKPYATDDQLLWMLIRNRAKTIAFKPYKEFIDKIMCDPTKLASEHGYDRQDLSIKAIGEFVGLDAYKLLRSATELYLMQEVGVLEVNKTIADLKKNFDDSEEYRRLGRRISTTEIDDIRKKYYVDLEKDSQDRLVLPYFDIIKQKLIRLPLKLPDEIPENCYGVLRSKLIGPLAIELIWSYWHEEGMLVQSLNAISLRFQNRRLKAGHDALANFNLGPLRPLNNIFWGYLQEEPHRLTVFRRAYEYDQQYGITLQGKAVPQLNSADSRTEFLEAFHNLLHLCIAFYREDNDTTKIADGFPLLNALQELHLELSTGLHNQCGGLTWTARAEMMIQQWLLARQEMREFLGGRIMVPYPEPWMDKVDTMKKLQNWNDVPITHFRDLGVFGEQILLSVRYGNWSEVDSAASAANWARYWRDEIQGYIHAYRAVTGVDLSATVNDTRQAVNRFMPPSLLLARKKRKFAVPKKHRLPDMVTR